MDADLLVNKNVIKRDYVTRSQDILHRLIITQCKNKVYDALREK